LVDIFRQGKREELLGKIPYVISFAIQDSPLSNTMLRQLSVKLAQRIALTYLKPRVVSWRYQKGRKSLLQNLGASNQKSSDNEQIDEEDEDIDIPDHIEEIVEKLLNGLRDKDTVVRWSAAKGIGRITMRLPRLLCDDIVGSVLGLLSSGETDSAWHGGCLALAELARRGLLLPERLDAVVPAILKALEYDERKGSHSVGAHVRDAACYVCWAFARAYAPQVMAPHVGALAVGLIKAAVYDREVNCRRAAAAAFQENVGRQGNFPHGIEILTRADYFTLSNRQNAYLEISYFIAQYPEYCQSLINDLVRVKLQHWDKSIRELTALTLYKLCDRDVIYMGETIVPALIPECFSSDLNTRHGALICLSEVMKALSIKHGYIFTDKIQDELREIVPTIEAKRLYRGRGGEIIREGICRFIEGMALSKIVLPDTTLCKAAVGPRQIKKQTVLIFQETIDTNLKHPTEEIIGLAVRAFKAFAAEYYTAQDDYGKLVVANCIRALKTDPNPASRRGYALALGALPAFLIDNLVFKDICAVLISKIHIELDPDSQDAESRRNAVLGLVSLCETVGIGENGVNASNVNEIFEAILKGTQDYAIDKRGDIGSIVRESAMLAIQRWANLLCSSEEGMILKSERVTVI
jgi:hypothetical protein